MREKLKRIKIYLSEFIQCVVKIRLIYDLEFWFTAFKTNSQFTGKNPMYLINLLKFLLYT